MLPQNPNYKNSVQAIFAKAGFINELGIKLVTVNPGICETSLEILPKHLQQNGVTHAGVLATLADHTSGAAAGSLIAENEIVLTSEFKINLLRSSVGQQLIARAEVLKPGKTITVCEAKVFDVKDGVEKLAAVALVSLAVVKNDNKKI